VNAQPQRGCVNPKVNACPSPSGALLKEIALHPGSSVFCVGTAPLGLNTVHATESGVYETEMLEKDTSRH
jgi:hypothetical protein